MLYAHGRSPARASPAATEIMFCSATPALMNRRPIRSRSGSSALKPRSPVRKTVDSSSATSIIARQKVARIPRLVLLPLDFANGLGVLLGRHRQVVPLHPVLHEGDPVPLDRTRDH